MIAQLSLAAVAVADTIMTADREAASRHLHATQDGYADIQRIHAARMEREFPGGIRTISNTQPDVECTCHLDICWACR